MVEGSTPPGSGAGEIYANLGPPVFEEDDEAGWQLRGPFLYLESEWDEVCDWRGRAGVAARGELEQEIVELCRRFLGESIGGPPQPSSRPPRSPSGGVNR